jgi:hypothetical protein
MKRVIIDLNVRLSFGDKNDATYSGFEDVIGEIRPKPGEPVEVIEIESGICGHGRILGVDLERRLLFLDVDWKALVAPRKAPA